MRGAGILLLGAILLLPPAVASSGEGRFLLQGQSEFPWGTQHAFQPLVVFNNDSSSISHFQLIAPHARLLHLGREAYEVGPADKPVTLSPYGSLRNESHHFTNATISISTEAGHVALYPGEGTSCSLSASGPTPSVSRERTVFSNVQYTTIEDPYASNYAFQKTISGPHMVGKSPGSLQASGPMLLKVYGPDLIVESNGETHRFPTGLEKLEIPGKIVRRWALLELPAGTRLDAVASHDWQFAGRRIDAQWDGRALFLPVEGVLETWDARYSPRGGVAHVEGSFQAALSPMRRDGRILTEIVLSGELAGTSLHAEALPLATQVVQHPSLAKWALSAVGATVLAGSAYAVGRTSRRPRMATAVARAPPPAPSFPFTVEDCVEAANQAAAEEDWVRAREWFERAHRLAPTSVRICCDLAFSHHQLGDSDTALRLYERAVGLGDPDGEASFNGGLTALAADRPLDEAEAWFERALAIEPALVRYLDEDEEARVLDGRPRFEAAMRDAWARLHASQQDPDA